MGSLSSVSSRRITREGTTHPQIQPASDLILSVLICLSFMESARRLLSAVRRGDAVAPSTRPSRASRSQRHRVLPSLGVRGWQRWDRGPPSIHESLSNRFELGTWLGALTAIAVAVAAMSGGSQRAARMRRRTACRPPFLLRVERLVRNGARNWAGDWWSRTAAAAVDGRRSSRF